MDDTTFTTAPTDTLATQDGVIAQTPYLDLDLDDTSIVQTLHAAIEESLDWYNDSKGYNLKNKRHRNVEYFNGKQIDENKLYRHQTPYTDNELFVAKDSILSYVTARASQPEVYPAGDGKEERMYAQHLEKYIKWHSDKFNLQRIEETTANSAMDKYVGWIKLHYDKNYGKHGEIIPETIDPDHVIVDYRAKLGGNPRFIAHVQKATVQELIEKFPDKEAEVLKLAGIERKGSKNITKEIAYREVWFTYYEDDGTACEAVAWYSGKVVLDKQKDPNWLYDSEEGDNFLDTPMKPFVPFNFWNDGTNMIDKTSGLEQAIPQQDILNKTGRQVLDNLATANGFKVLDSHALSSQDAENWTGDPNQLLLVKTKAGQNVSDVVQQFPAQVVSPELIQFLDKTRQVIHNIVGTPTQFSGGDDGEDDQTATEAMMIKNQASGRHDRIVRALDVSMGLYFNLLVQMMIVHYSEDHYATISGTDGKYDYIVMHRKKISPNMTVRVQSGTTLPFDKARQESVAVNLLKLGVLSPYDGYKLLHMDDPKQLYDNYIKYKTQPQALSEDLATDAANGEAVEDFKQLLAGETPEQREDPTADYIEELRKEMISDRFIQAKGSIQNAIIKFINKALDSWELREELDKFSAGEKQNPGDVPIPPELAATGVIPPPPPMPAPLPGIPGAPAPAAPAQPPVPAPAGNPIQAIMQAQPAPIGAPAPAPNVNPSAQPQTNGTNVGQLPPV